MTHTNNGLKNKFLELNTNNMNKYCITALKMNERKKKISSS